MKPILIEFIGLPNAGKSALIKKLGHRLYLEGCLNQAIRRDKGIPGEFIHRENYYDRELLILTETISEMIRCQDSSLADVVFIHRGPWDAIAFFESLVKFNAVSKTKARAGIWLAKSDTSRVDYLVLVEIRPEISLARGSPPSQDSTIRQDLVNDPTFLEILSQSYQELKEDLKKKLSDRFLILDGTRPVEENLETLLEVILSKLEITRENCGYSVFNTISKEEGIPWSEKIQGNGRNLILSLKEKAGIEAH